MLEELLSLPNGAKFYKCDLHNHTPKDNRFHCDSLSIETEQQKYSFAQTLVKFAKNTQGLDILGITEHNDVSWLSYIQAAADEHGLIIFPGVELGALAGQHTIHLLALFDPGTSQNTLDHWLSLIGLLPDQRFHNDGTPKAVQKDTRELTALIHTHSNGIQGISIAAHISSKNGLLHGMEGENRILAYNDKNLLAVEIPSLRSNLSAFERKLVNGELDSYGSKRVACLNHSDGRAISEDRQVPSIGSKSTYIKLSSPTVEGLRQAFLDFDSRVRLKTEYEQYNYPKILGLVIEGGFLGSLGEKFRLHFNNNLNCIIGGRGVGKSAMIEVIRYVFDINVKTDSNRKSTEDLVKNTLRDGAIASIFYETDDGTRYLIKRSFGNPPKVFDVLTGIEKKGLHPSGLLSNGSIEVYGQKEIYEISKDPAFQLKLLDNYITELMKPILEKEQSWIISLQEKSREISNLKKSLLDLLDKLDDLPAIQEEIIRLEKQEVITKLQRKRQLDKEHNLLDQADRAVLGLLAQIENFSASSNISNELLSNQDIQDLPHSDFLLRQREILNHINTIFVETLNNLPVTLSQIWGEGSKDRSVWETAYHEEDDTYKSLLREFPGASAERYIHLQQKQVALEEHARHIKQFDERIKELQAQRDSILDHLRLLRRKEAFDLRSQKASQMNDALGDAIEFKVILEGNRSAYSLRLQEWLRGSGITSSVIEQVVQTKSDHGYYDPAHLVSSIRHLQDNPGSDLNDLTTIYKITSSYQQRLLKLSDEILSNIEAYGVPDLPVIRLRVGNNYKPLQELSVGQKCTAILSLILLDKRIPLIIDQPEDDLDNRFIFDDIVKTLRREKERRQFVIATHNANIPVSGDAELIIVMDANEQHGWVSCLGSIDDTTVRHPVENVLEGGREAFRIRKEKYGV